MAYLVLVFVAILLATFALMAFLTRKTKMDETIAQRLTFIHVARTTTDRAASETEQLFKATAADGNFAWLNALLERYSFSQMVQKQLMLADISASVATVVLTSLGLVLVGFVIAWFYISMPLVDLGAGVALGLLPYGVISFRKNKRIAAFNSVLAETIDMLARALRAGHSVMGAIEMLTENAQEPAASEFNEVFKQMNLGLPMRDALMQLLDRVPSPDLRVLVTAIMVQKDTGGNLVEILDRTVFVIRERLRIEGEIQTQTAQGRLTGWILSALPIVMLLLLNLINPGYSNVLLHDPLGRKLSYFCVGMLAVGAFTIRQIINGIEV